MNTLNTDNLSPAETESLSRLNGDVPAPKGKVRAPKGSKLGKRDASRANGTAKRIAKAKPEKAPIDPIMGNYPKLKAWPAKAGHAPDKVCIASARALLGSPRSAGSKRELAIAAYLRADSGKYHVGLVADALMKVCGGSFNPLLNVINADIERSMGLGKCIKAKVEGGTSYRLELNAKGKARVAKYLTAMGLVKGAGEPEAPEADKVPAAETPLPEAPEAVEAPEAEYGTTKHWAE